MVFADTHGSSRRMLEVAMHERDAEACIHLGDGVADTDVLTTLFSPSAIYRVQGNCDRDCSEYENRLVAYGKTPIWLTHGHHFGVKYGLEELWQEASRKKAQVVLFGHTHLPRYELYRGIHMMNPGSLTMPRGPAGATYGVITLDEGEAPLFDICRYANIGEQAWV